MSEITVEKTEHYVKTYGPGDGEEATATVVTKNTTPRDFSRIEFHDRYGLKCNLQDSSLATEPAIWFGVGEDKVNHFVNGKWEDVELPKDAIVHNRMHLTQAMVKQLLPYLTKFAETGCYLSDIEIEEPS